MSRLEALRAELQNRGLQYFLVPRADEFQSAYPPASAERLAWLSGYTGSAGVAVVGQGRAALFVDGRYTEQARRQVSPDHWEHHHLVNEPVDRWLRRVLHEGDRVGFDARLHTPDGLAPLREAVRRFKAELVAVADNPIDALWLERPALPTEPIELYPEQFAGAPRASKLRDVVEDLAAEGADALIVSDPTMLMWLLNLRGLDTATMPVAFATGIVYKSGQADLFIEGNKVPGDVGAKLTEPGSGCVLLRPPGALGAALDALKNCRVLADQGTVNQWTVDRLRTAGAEVSIGRDPCAIRRACKSASQIDGLRAAHRRDAAALVRFLAWFQRVAPGEHDEWTVAQELNRLRALGERFRGLSFRTISAAGPNAAFPHYTVTRADARRLQGGDIYLVDSGAQYLDATTDVTRVTVIGEPSEEMRLRYTQVLKGHLSLGMARFPRGTTGSQLDILARQYLWQAGVDYDHGTGHGVGLYLSVHEGPQNISKRPNTIGLQPGMVLSNEPGYYKVGSFGIRIENLVVVQPLQPPPDGAEMAMLCFETLTLVPYERRLIDVEALAPHEIDWVDEYHAGVWRQISPLLGDDVAASEWLRSATLPLRG